MIFLKKAEKTAETNTLEAQKVVNDMLTNIEKHGEQAVRDYSAKLDNWSGEILLSEDEIKSYVDKDEPYQCAGSYKYESHGSKLFSDIKGSPFTIQGLALTPLLKALEDLDLYFKK